MLVLNILLLLGGIYVLGLCVYRLIGGAAGQQNKEQSRHTPSYVICPYCGAQAPIKGDYWECGYCGDSGRWR